MTGSVACGTHCISVHAVMPLSVSLLCFVAIHLTDSIDL